MAVGASAAASGAQQAVSEKYERLDGVKVHDCLQRLVEPLNRPHDTMPSSVDGV